MICARTKPNTLTRTQPHFFARCTRNNSLISFQQSFAWSTRRKSVTSTAKSLLRISMVDSCARSSRFCQTETSSSTSSTGLRKSTMKYRDRVEKSKKQSFNGTPRFSRSFQKTWLSSTRIYSKGSSSTWTSRIPDSSSASCCSSAWCRPKMETILAKLCHNWLIASTLSDRSLSLMTRLSKWSRSSAILSVANKSSWNSPASSRTTGI